jgi:hypothetical protein
MTHHRSTADMIADLLELVQKELGHPLPGTSRTMIAAALGERYGGQRIYVPAYPKAQQGARLLIGATVSVGPRQVRRIVRGR